MIRPIVLAGAAGLLMFAGCDQPMPGDPVENIADTASTGPADNQSAPETVNEVDDGPATNFMEEQDMSDRAKEAGNEARPKEPALRPRPDIKPAPFQPPAEVDPAHRHPGDTVPE